MIIDRIGNAEGFIFDLDGTIYLGESALPGAVETISMLRQQVKRLLFVSNKPLETRQAYADKLTHLGMPTDAEDVLTSAYVLGSYLVKHQPELRCFVIGEENLRAELRGYGLRLVHDFHDQEAMQVIDPTGIDAVVVAFDRTLNYLKLNTAYQALVRGARFFATNTDKACPMPDGAIPDAGAIIAALEYITGRKLELSFGKPSPLMLQAAVAHLELPAEKCIMIGDRLETDIRMGQQAGMSTALVLTGTTNREHLIGAAETPDIILDTLYDLLDMLY